jgi:hypothetical protein
MLLLACLTRDRAPTLAGGTVASTHVSRALTQVHVGRAAATVADGAAPAASTGHGWAWPPG